MKRTIFAVVVTVLIASVLLVNPTAAMAETVLKLWTFPVDQLYEEELPLLVKQFEEMNPGVKIEYEIIPWAEGQQKFDVAINAGSPPDVFWGANDAKYIKTGLQIPLEDWLTADELADYEQNSLEDMRIDGKIYSLPLYTLIWTLGGNQELLEEAGIDWISIQEQGWTFEEFAEITAKLTKELPDGRTQYGFIMPGYNDELLEFVLLGSGVYQMIGPDGNLLWTKKALTEAYTYIRELLDAGTLPREIAGMSAIKRWELFNSWDTAIFGRGIPYFESMSITRNQDIADGKIAGKPISYISLPIPHKSGVREVSYGASQGYAAFRQKRYQGDDHTALAVQLAKFLTGEYAGKTSVNLGYLPASLSARGRSAHLMADLNPRNVAFTERQLTMTHSQYQEQISADLDAKRARIRVEVSVPIYQAFIAYELTPEQAATQFMERATRILQR